MPSQDGQVPRERVRESAWWREIEHLNLPSLTKLVARDFREHTCGHTKARLNIKRIAARMSLSELTVQLHLRRLRDDLHLIQQLPSGTAAIRSEWDGIYVMTIPADLAERLERLAESGVRLPRRCSVPGCTRMHEAKGYCRRHYAQSPRNRERLEDGNTRGVNCRLARASEKTP